MPHRKEESPIASDLLDNETWQMLFALGTINQFRRGEIIYFQEEPNVNLVCLMKGELKNCIFLLDGTEKTLNILKAPSITGETSIVDNKPSVCCAVALTDVTVSIIPREKAREVLLSNASLMALTLQILTKKMRSMLLQVEGVVTSVPQRLARMLLTLNGYGVYSHQEHDDRLVITHDELARFLGTTRPKITEFLSEFTKMGLIERGRGYITIKDKNRLTEIREHGMKIHN